MRRLVRVAVVMGGFSVVNMTVGFLRSKYGAVVLGPAGIGVLAQATTFVLLTITVCTLSAGTGITKLVAEALAGRDGEKLRAVLDTVFWFLLAAAAVTVGVLAPLTGPLSGWLLGEPALSTWLLGVVVSIPLAVLAIFCEAVILGAARHDAYTRASIAATLLGVVAFVALTHVLGLRGALASLAVAALLRLACFAYVVREVVPWRPRLGGRLSRPILGVLLGYAAALLATGAFLELSNLGVRTMILGRLGAGANGIYQVPVALSSYYSVFFTNGLWGHLYPRMSGSLTPAEQSSEVEAALRLTALGMAGAAAVLVAAREALVVVLYSRQFAEAAALIPLYAVGDLLFLLSLVHVVAMLALGRLRACVALWGGFCLLRLALAALFLSPLGLRGPVVAYVLSAGLFLVTLLVYHRRHMHLQLTAPTRRLLLGAALLSAIPSLLPVPAAASALLQVLVTALWLLRALSAEERGLVVHYLTRLAARGLPS
ncbi:MAG: oligosaccharide flippase family protein [Candidatus Rokubacteria bacterium]|nr:oligosaccharide flippase family protein [Candidatus Rokubacteria bacterium]